MVRLQGTLEEKMIYGTGYLAIGAAMQMLHDERKILRQIKRLENEESRKLRRG